MVGAIIPKVDLCRKMKTPKLVESLAKRNFAIGLLQVTPQT